MSSINNSLGSASSRYSNLRNENPQVLHEPHANIDDVARSSISSTQAQTGIQTRSQARASVPAMIPAIPSQEISLDPEESNRLVQEFRLQESVCLENYNIDFSVIQTVDQPETVAILTSDEELELERFNAEFNKTGIPSYLSIAKIDEELGHGVFLKPNAKPIPQGSIVGVYTGKMRLTSSNEHLGPYVFHIVKCSRKSKAYTQWLQEDRNNKDPLLSVDAEELGNFTRFINHGKENNANLEYCFRRYINVENNSEKIAIIFKAKKEILPGEQLLYDYGHLYWSHGEPVSITPSTYFLGRTIAPKSVKRESSKTTGTSTKVQKIARDGIGRSNHFEIRRRNSADEREHKEPAIAPTASNLVAFPAPPSLMEQHQLQFGLPQRILSLTPPPPILHAPYPPHASHFYDPVSAQNFYTLPQYSLYPPLFPQSSAQNDFGEELEIPFAHSSSPSNPLEQPPLPESPPSIDQHSGMEPYVPFASSSSQPNVQTGSHDSGILSLEQMDRANELIKKWIGNSVGIPNLLEPNEFDQNALKSQLLRESQSMMKFLSSWGVSVEHHKFFALLKIQAYLCLQKKFPEVSTSVRLMSNGFKLVIKLDGIPQELQLLTEEANRYGNSIIKDINLIFNLFKKSVYKRPF